MKLLRKPTAAAVFTLLAATGISTLSPVAQAAPGRRIVLAVKGEPQQGFDPIKGWGRYGNPLFYSTLIKRNAKLDLVGDLATKWSLSADGKTWTINLREGVKFADGKPLTAEDVIYTFETAKKSAGLIDLNVVESVRAPNPSTVEIKLKEPRITFLNRLTTLGIVPKHAYNDAFGNTPMGSGPFKFVSWSKGQQLIVEPNSQYYGNKSGFERITFLFTEEDASLAAARAGQLHLVAVPHGFANQVPSKMKLSVAKSVDNRGIMFPMQPATGRKTADGNPIGNDITSDAAIRKAINIAINRQALAKGALNGYGAPAWGSADGLPWDNPQQRMSDSDMAAAKAILKQGGWVESGGKLTKNGKEARFPLLYPASDSTRQALALATADMVRPLGITMELAGKSWDDIKREMHSSAVMFGWGSHDPIEAYNLFHASYAGKEYYNPGFYQNSTVSAHLDAAERSTSFQASLPHWKKAQWDGKTGYGMKGDAAWAWLVNLDHVYFVDKCLDIGPRQIEPHGHGYPVTWNVQDWKWTCK